MTVGPARPSAARTSRPTSTITGVRVVSSASEGGHPEGEHERVAAAAQQGQREQRGRAAPPGLVLVGHAQQLVGIAERNSPAAMRRRTGRRP